MKWQIQIVKFPIAKVLTPDERLVKSCSNLIHSTYEHGNKFVKPQMKADFTENQIRTLLKRYLIKWDTLWNNIKVCVVSIST